MGRNLINRIVQFAVVMIVVTFGATALANLVPGSPAYLILGAYASPGAIKAFNHQYGFDRPLFDRYWHWLIDALQGNLGQSIQAHTPVTSVIGQALPVTLELAILSLVVSLILAISLAMISVLHPGGMLDRIFTAIASALVSVPAFISAVLIVLIFAVKVKVFPPSGWVALSSNLGQNLDHAALPIITLVSTTCPLLLRVFRSDLLAVLQTEYIASAHARGLPEWYTLLRHAFRPAATSLLTISGLVFGYLLGGVIIVETFYATPGLGLLVSSAELGKDIPVVQGVVVVVALAYLIINLLVDFAQGLIDPRVRRRGVRTT